MSIIYICTFNALAGFIFAARPHTLKVIQKQRNSEVFNNHFRSFGEYNYKARKKKESRPVLKMSGKNVRYLLR